MIGASVLTGRTRTLQCLSQARVSRSIASTARASTRPSSTDSSKHSNGDALPALSPRWLSDTKLRIGKCLTFGMNAEQVQRASKICKILGEDWKELLAGSEGYLTNDKRAGLLGHRVSWGEQDVMGHLNNVMYIRYAETGRVNWAYNIALHLDPEHKREWQEMCTPKGDGMILKSMKTDYKFPIAWPDKVSVFHKLRKLPTAGESSFVLDAMILSEREQRPAARCLEDIVVYDYRVGKKITLRPFMLAGFEKLYQEQEEARETNTRRVHKILEDVRQLEKDSWDRADAKEDLGGSTVNAVQSNSHRRWSCSGPPSEWGLRRLRHLMDKGGRSLGHLSNEVFGDTKLGLLWDSADIEASGTGHVNPHRLIAQIGAWRQQANHRQNIEALHALFGTNTEHCRRDEFPLGEAMDHNE
ncbi:hypothetical protein V495_00619 [Pseudogymnoascus sp. VKM F-4514 (FW-929)]|nr:hypothetical protein V495_00619 [Pseudogymnoascus sp. VKM F-4514 (FW-929)]KFY66044.1 hypothetical protein V497_01150 [Pseudogymnoascus sp. VKM F-4516 (FW-969)]